MWHTLLATTLQFYIGEDIEEQQRAHGKNVYYQGVIERIPELMGA